jgi:rSAM/selenodomain-associated transferase 2
MISIVIPTYDAAEGLPATLSALVPAVVEGLVREVIVVDGGSRDATVRIVEEMGATLVTAPPGRGGQLAAGARRTRMPWLLFLHADTVLAPGWEREAAEFMRRIEQRGIAPMAAAFRFALDDIGFAPRWLEAMVRFRCHVLALPYGDQGLLIPRQLYETIGGYRGMPLMEDVDIVRRLGRRRLAVLRSCALTSARRYRCDGYLRRVLRNQMCLAMYFLGVPAERVAQIYAARREAPRTTGEVRSA